MLNLDDLVEKESRELLVFAARRIFTNLAILEPTLDLKTVTAPISSTCKEALCEEVWQTAEDYSKLFRKVDAVEEDDDNEEDSEEEDDKAAP